MTETVATTILVVDDERAITDTLVAILQRAGYRAIAAYGPAEALAVLDDVSPALLISDVMMPGMNGVDLAIQACKLHPELKVFLISGHAGTQDLLNAAQPTACWCELIAKPISPDELLRKIASVLADSEAARQLRRG